MRVQRCSVNIKVVTANKRLFPQQSRLGIHLVMTIEYCETL
jgi:hypothetical protein